MKRVDAERLFGGKIGLAQAMDTGVTTLYDWPDELPRRLQDRVYSALLHADRVGEALALLTKEKRKNLKEKRG